ncbi:hypothetical protein GXW82_36350 [Streptacidiphilus sp. 4-A2]|nr:hypothetical protein [Streptacidiphilus sp. 4-A2]
MPTPPQPGRRRLRALSGVLLALAGLCSSAALVHPTMATARTAQQRAAAAGLDTLAWGDNTYGQATVPDAVQQGASAVAAGDFHSLALKDGAVTAWAATSTSRPTSPPSSPPASPPSRAATCTRSQSRTARSSPGAATATAPPTYPPRPSPASPPWPPGSSSPWPSRTAA